MFNSLFDAYTVRKVAPRLIVAVIGVNLSIYLCVAAVDITNIIGGGIADLMRQPFKDSGNFESVGLPGNALNVVTGGVGILGVVGLGAGVAGSAGVAASVSAAGWAVVGAGATASVAAFVVMLLVAFISVALIALAIAATLVIRYGAILILTLFAPIAIALLVLPGTEKYFKAWWDIFMKTLIMYPIIAIIFALSDILGALLLVTLTQQNQVVALVAIFVVIIALYAPLFMIPFAYKMAGGIIGGVYDFANKNAIARVGERVKKMKEDPHTAYGKFMEAQKVKRREAGLNAGDMYRGYRGAFRARKAPRAKGMSRRSAMRSAFAGAYSSKGGADFLNKELEEHQKKGFGHKEGYDDHYRAMLEVENPNDLEGIMKVLEREDSSKYGMGADKFAATQQAALEIQDEMKAAGGVEHAHRIAVMSMMNSVTAFKSNADMIQQVEKAAGNDSTLRSMMLAKVQKAQDGLGRHDVAGAGFTNTSLVLETYAAEKKRLQREEPDLSHHEVDERMKKFATQLQDEGIVERDSKGKVVINPETGEEQMAIRSYKDMVEEKKSDVAQGQGHERSLNAMMQHKMKKFDQAVKRAQIRVDNKEIDHISKDEKVQELTAKLENMGEASAYFSGANRELVSKVLRGENVGQLAGSEYKVAKEGSWIKDEETGDYVLNPDGSRMLNTEVAIPGLKINTTVKRQRPKMVNNVQVFENGKPVMETYEAPAKLNIRQLADEHMRSSEEHEVYNTNKREFGRAKAAMDEAAREEAARLSGLGPHAGAM